jgi:hypothetical protein
VTNHLAYAGRTVHTKSGPELIPAALTCLLAVRIARLNALRIIRAVDSSSICGCCPWPEETVTPLRILEYDAERN